MDADPEVVSRAGAVLAQHSAFIRQNQPKPNPRVDSGSPPAPTQPKIASESVSEAKAPATPPEVQPEVAAEPPAVQTYKVRLGSGEVEMPREHVEQLLSEVHSVAEQKRALEQLKASLGLDFSYAEWSKTATHEQKAAIDSIVRGGAPPAPDEDQDDESEDSPRTNPDMERVVKILMNREMERDQETKRVARDTLISQTMEKYEPFKDKGLFPIALRTIKAELDADPKLDPVAVIAARAAEYGSWLASVKKSDDESTPAVARKAPAVPKPGAPKAGTAFTAKDMADGKVRDAVVSAFLKGQLQRR